MTCVVAIADDERVVVAADCAGANLGPAPEVHSLTVPKVFKVGRYVVGYACSWRFGQVLRYTVSWPEPEPGCDFLQFVSVELVSRIRRALIEEGCMRRFDDGRERGAQAIVAHGSSLVFINEGFEVGRLEEPYVAIGGGHLVAYGALHACAIQLDLSLERRAEIALDAACRYVPGIRGPYVLRSTGA